ncbi:MAG: AzlC family ABC transporter permease [Microvirga sp.]|nr:AzlC family ABC transporter permease [Microvirga sp.]
MNQAASPARRAPFLRGVIDALSLPAWIVGFAFLGVGSLAEGVGFPFAAAVLSTILIWAGPAQVIFYGGLASGTALPAIAIAVGLSSIRLLPMTMSLLPLIRRPGQGVLIQLLVAHYVAVMVWIENMRRLPSIEPDERVGYFLGFANACLFTSAALTGVGFYAAAAVAPPFAAGLLFLTPLFFAISLIAGARGRLEWSALALGAVLAPTFGYVAGKDFDLLLTGLVGGTAAYLIGKTRR